MNASSDIRPNGRALIPFLTPMRVDHGRDEPFRPARVRKREEGEEKDEASHGLEGLKGGGGTLRGARRLSPAPPVPDMGSEHEEGGDGSVRRLHGGPCAGIARVDDGPGPSEGDFELRAVEQRAHGVALPDAWKIHQRGPVQPRLAPFPRVGVLPNLAPGVGRFRADDEPDRG